MRKSFAKKSTMTEVEGYAKVVKTSIIEPAKMILQKYLSTPKQGNLLSLKDHMEYITKFKSVIEIKKKNANNECEFDELINLLDECMVNINKAIVQTPIKNVESETLDSFYKEAITEASLYIQKLETTDDISQKKHMVYYSIALCEVHLGLLRKQIAMEKTPCTLYHKQLEEFKTELEALYCKFQGFLNMISNTK